MAWAAYTLTNSLSNGLWREGVAPMQFKTVSAYLTALRKDPGLTMIPLGMVAEWKGISRSAVSEQIKSGKLEGLEVKGQHKTWRGVCPDALFAQEQAAENGARERRLQVLRTLSQAAAAGHQLSYGDVMAPAGLSSRNPRHRAEIGTVLSVLSRDSLSHHGFLISAIVVQKTTGRPNALFFTLARQLGCLGEHDDETTFWQHQKDRVFAAFRAKPKADRD